MPIRDLIKFEGEPVVDSTFATKPVVRFDGDESNPVLTIQPIINYSLSCIVLQGHYIGEIKEGNGYGFEISNTLSNRTQIMSGTVVPTVHGVLFQTDCAALNVHGDTLIQAFAFVDNSIIWGNPLRTTLPDFTKPIPLQARYQTPQYTNLDADSVRLHIVVTGGAQPLRTIEIRIHDVTSGSTFIATRRINQSDLDANGEASVYISGDFLSKTIQFSLIVFDGSSPARFSGESVLITFIDKPKIIARRSDGLGVVPWNTSVQLGAIVQITIRVTDSQEVTLPRSEYSGFRPVINVDWLTLDDSLSTDESSYYVRHFRASDNLNTFQRTGQIKFELLDTDDNVIATSNIINITQEAKPSLAPLINVEPTEYTIDWDDTTPQTYQVTLTNSTPDDVNFTIIGFAQGLIDWVTGSFSNNIATITPTSNNPNQQPRTVNAFLQVRTDEGTTPPVFISLTQRAQPDFTPKIEVTPKSILVPNDDTNERTFTITLTNQGAIKPTIENVADWVNAVLNPQGTVLTVNAKSVNTSTSQRNNVITFSITTGFGTASTTATFSQRRSTIVPPTPPTIDITNTPQNIAYNLTSATFNFTLTNASSSDVSIVQATLPSWISTSQISGNQLLLTFNANTDKRNSRTASIRLSVQTDDGNDNDSAVLVQAKDPAPLLRVLTPPIVIDADNTSAQDYFIELINATFDDFNTETNLPTWLSITYDSANSKIQLTPKSENTGENRRTAQVGISVTTTVNGTTFSNGNILSLHQNGTGIIPPAAPMLFHNIPPTGIITFRSHLSTTFKFEIVITGLPLIREAFDTSLSLGALSNLVLTAADSTRTDNRTTHFVTGTLNENPFGRQRNTAFTLEVENATGTSDPLSLELRQSAKPADPPTISIEPKTSDFNYNESPDSIIISVTNASYQSGNDDVTIESQPSWITSIERDYQTSGMSFTASTNQSTNPRTGEVVLKVTANSLSATTTYRFAQRGNPIVSINVNPQSRTIEYNDTAEKEFEITLTNADFSDVSIEDQVPDDWTTWRLDSDSESLKVKANSVNTDTANRIDSINLNVNTSSGQSDTAQVSLVQKRDPRAQIQAAPVEFAFENNEGESGYTTYTIINTTTDDVSIVGIDNGSAFNTRHVPTDRRVYFSVKNVKATPGILSATYELQVPGGHPNSSVRISVTQKGAIPEVLININPGVITLDNANNPVFNQSLSKTATVTISNTNSRTIVFKQDAVGIGEGSTYDWLSVSFDGVETITASATGANTGSEIRFANYSVCVQYNRNDEKCIGFYVEQAPIPRLAVSPQAWTPDNEAQSQEFTITGATSFPSVRENPDVGWLGLSRITAAHKFTATISENVLDTERTTKLIVSAGIGQGTAEVTIRQDHPFRLEATATPSVLRKTVSPAETSVTLGFTITSNDLSMVGVSDIDRAVTLTGPDSRGAVSVLINIGQVDFTQGFKIILIDVIEKSSSRRLDQVDIILSLAGAPP